MSINPLTQPQLQTQTPFAPQYGQLQQSQSPYGQQAQMPYGQQVQSPYGQQAQQPWQVSQQPYGQAQMFGVQPILQQGLPFGQAAYGQQPFGQQPFGLQVSSLGQIGAQVVSDTVLRVVSACLSNVLEQLRIDPMAVQSLAQGQLSPQAYSTVLVESARRCAPIVAAAFSAITAGSHQQVFGQTPYQPGISPMIGGQPFGQQPMVPQSGMAW